MLFNRIKSFYFNHLSLKIGKLDCHFQVKEKNVIRLIKKYNLKFESILDIGCANGLYSVRLCKKYPEVSYLQGFDRSEKSICYARDLSRKIFNIKSNFYVSDIENTKINNKFDLILFLDCLQYASNKDFIFEQMRGSLKENGHLILYVPPSDREYIGLPEFIYNRQPIYDIPYPTINDINELFRRHGFTIVSQHWVGGKSIRYYMAFKYWLKSYHKSLPYFFFPFDVFFACFDKRKKSFGYGLFFLLCHNKNTTNPTLPE